MERRKKQRKQRSERICFLPLFPLTLLFLLFPQLLHPEDFLHHDAHAKAQGRDAEADRCHFEEAPLECNAFCYGCVEREDEDDENGENQCAGQCFVHVSYNQERCDENEDGDDVGDPAYNQHIQKPYKGRHENLWRQDHLYDIVLVVGHNDDPVVKGEGSGIFVHLRRLEGIPTAGCVALDKDDLLKILKDATLKSCFDDCF